MFQKSILFQYCIKVRNAGNVGTPGSYPLSVDRLVGVAGERK